MIITLLLLKKALASEIVINDIVIEPVTSEQRVEYFAEKYNVSSEEMKTVINCESGYNINAYNGNDIHRYSVGSHGIAQFSQQTFDYYSAQAGVINGSPYNENDAIETMAYMFSLGESGKKHWTCYRTFYLK